MACKKVDVTNCYLLNATIGLVICQMLLAAANLKSILASLEGNIVRWTPHFHRLTTAELNFLFPAIWQPIRASIFVHILLDA
jgi:hypothetical protein